MSTGAAAHGWLGVRQLERHARRRFFGLARVIDTVKTLFPVGSD
jgi:hypothetical protein